MLVGANPRNCVGDTPNSLDTFKLSLSLIPVIIPVNDGAILNSLALYLLLRGLPSAHPPKPNGGNTGIKGIPKLELLEELLEELLDDEELELLLEELLKLLKELDDEEELELKELKLDLELSEEELLNELEDKDLLDNELELKLDFLELLLEDKALGL